MQVASLNVHSLFLPRLDRDRLAVEPRPDRLEQSNVGETKPRVDEPGEAPQETDKTPGVIRRLEAGQFKGVADVRLRINFHEQLVERAGGQAIEELRDGADSLTRSVTGEINALIESLGDELPLAGDTEDLLSDFTRAVESAVSAVDDRGSLDVGEFTAEIKAAFDTLVEQLRNMLGSTGPDLSPLPDVGVSDERQSSDETLVNPRAVDSDGNLSEPPARGSGATELDDRIGSLTSSFEQLLADLVSAFESTLALPDPTPAPGNGVAYARFLAIYDELRRGGTQLDATA